MRDPSQSNDRRGWIVALSTAVVAHVILISALVVTQRSSRSSPHAVRDVPIMPGGMLRDTAQISGKGPEPTAESLNVMCTYVLAEVARLSSGPRSEPGKLGCKDTLSFPAGAAWKGELIATYDTDGRLVEINNPQIGPGDPLEMMVQAWDLATPRQDRQWPGMPRFTIRIGTRQ